MCHILHKCLKKYIASKSEKTYFCEILTSAPGRLLVPLPDHLARVGQLGQPGLQARLQGPGVHFIEHNFGRHVFRTNFCLDFWSKISSNNYMQNESAHN
jgi:hypothetical protein